MHILIAEDDATSRILLGKLLDKWGHTVTAVSDGEEARRRLQQKDAPPLAILDWMMPRMNGVEVCREIRAVETRNPTYLILLTGRDSSDDIVEGLEAGADDYVTKPFNNNELRARIRVAQRMIGLQQSLNRNIRDLEEAMKHVKTLQGILPICMHCHKIRTDEQAWQRLEGYLEDHTDAHISHGLCPQCLEKYYPEILDDETESEEDASNSLR